MPSIPDFCGALATPPLFCSVKKIFLEISVKEKGFRQKSRIVYMEVIFARPYALGLDGAQRR